MCAISVPFLACHPYALLHMLLPLLVYRCIFVCFHVSFPCFTTHDYILRVSEVSIAIMCTGALDLVSVQFHYKSVSMPAEP